MDSPRVPAPGYRLPPDRTPQRSRRPPAAAISLPGGRTSLPKPGLAGGYAAGGSAAMAAWRGTGEQHGARRTRGRDLPRRRRDGAADARVSLGRVGAGRSARLVREPAHRRPDLSHLPVPDDRVVGPGPV